MIILKKPQNGEKITLLTDEQLNFISTDRSQIHTGKSSGFDYLNLKIERKIDCSFPKSIRFEWEADEKGVIQISENEEFDFYYSGNGENFYDFENLKCGTRYFWRVLCENEISDTFYFDADSRVMLRSQTSPMQVRAMDSMELPIRIIAPGRVFRKDEVDATHSPMFHQVEGMVIDKGVTMADLKGTLNLVMEQLYGKGTVTRFRPHHFPFTEPSCEMDVQCHKCGGAGCPTCKGEGWIEVLGAGMIHPKVLKMAGIDTEVYSGWAFGMGLERMAMRRFKISDLRLIFENDIRFLEQF